MKYSQTISDELKDILKSCTTVAQRKEVAESNGLSIHTLNSIITGNRKITTKNNKCISELLRVAICNAKEMHFSLLDYYQDIKYL